MLRRRGAGDCSAGCGIEQAGIEAVGSRRRPRPGPLSVFPTMRRALVLPAATVALMMAAAAAWLPRGALAAAAVEKDRPWPTPMPGPIVSIAAQPGAAPDNATSNTAGFKAAVRC